MTLVTAAPFHLLAATDLTGGTPAMRDTEG